MSKKNSVLLFVLGLIFAAEAFGMKLSSSAFESGGTIPTKYTCDGQDVSPPLQIEAVPKNAMSLALIVDDPDVPDFVRKDRMWVHWVVFNIPPNTKGIPEGALPEGVLGKGTGGDLRYRGPCPPDREHRYFFKLYALDLMLDLPKGSTKEDLEKAMEGHIVAQTELMGRYNRKR